MKFSILIIKEKQTMTTNKITFAAMCMAVSAVKLETQTEWKWFNKVSDNFGDWVDNAVENTGEWLD